MTGWPRPFSQAHQAGREVSRGCAVARTQWKLTV